MKTPISHLLPLLMACLALLGSACSRGPLMEEFHTLPNANWNRFQTLWFEYTPAQADQNTQIELVIRYNESFPGNRIDLMATIHAPSGEQRFKEYHLITRDREGKITGLAPESAGNPPAWYEGALVLRQDFVFQERGLYRFEIENLMSKYDNRGIVELGLRITKAPRRK